MFPRSLHCLKFHSGLTCVEHEKVDPQGLDHEVYSFTVIFYEDCLSGKISSNIKVIGEELVQYPISGKFRQY